MTIQNKTIAELAAADVVRSVLTDKSDGKPLYPIELLALSQRVAEELKLNGLLKESDR